MLYPSQSYFEAADSRYSPYVTHLDPYARWASTPVYGPNNNDKNHPDGAMIAGDIVRGSEPGVHGYLEATLY